MYADFPYDLSARSPAVRAFLGRDLLVPLSRDFTGDLALLELEFMSNPADTRTRDRLLRQLEQERVWQRQEGASS